MAQNTYPDGFPLTPLEAIDFSYTFSTEEKQEWREWVKTATPEQQQELVETLHAIWIDNQNEVIPDGFNKEPESIEKIIELPSTQSQVSEKPEIIDNKNSKTEVDEILTPVVTPSEIPKPVNTNEVKILDEKPVEKEFVFNSNPTEPKQPDVVVPQTDTIQKNVTEPVKPPFTQPQNQPRQSHNSDNRNQNNQRNSQNNTQARNNNQQNTNSSLQSEEKKDQTSKQELNFFDFSRVRETATKNQLEKLQKEYIAARQERYTVEQNYHEKLNKLTNELDQKHEVLFDKVVQIALNFENVSAYIQLMTEKLLKINESNVELEKKVKSLELLLDNKINDLSYDKENTQHDIDRLFRELREMRENLRGEILDIKRTTSASTVDSFGEEGMKLKIDILTNKLNILENSLRNQSNQNRQIPNKKNEEQRNMPDKKFEAPKLKQATSESDTTLDLRDIV